MVASQRLQLFGSSNRVDSYRHRLRQFGAPASVVDQRLLRRWCNRQLYNLDNGLKAQPPKPLTLNKSGSNDILRCLLDVEMVKSARQAVTGDGICIGLTYKTNAFAHPKTVRNKELIKLIVDEVRSHEEL